MFGSLLLLVVVVVIVGVLVSRAAARRSGGTSARAPALRMLFSYVLLYGLVVVTSIGAAGLVGQLLDRLGTSGAFVAGSVEAARNGAFVVVGLPLCVLVALRVRRSLLTEPAERASLGWTGYVTAVSATSLVVAMVAAHDSLVWALGVGPQDPRAVGRVLVWSLVWLVHWRLDRALTPTMRAEPHLLLGSAIGLATTAVGVVGVVGNTLDLAFGLQRETFVDPQDQLRRAVSTLVVGGCVWALYWWRHASTASRGPLWHGYALLAGTVAGTVTAVVGAAWTLSSVLVWFLGDPESTTAATHFRSTPHVLAVAGVGTFLWWYHTGLLGHPGRSAQSGRTEVHRVRDYGSAAVGILACAVGGALLVVALVDAVTRSVAVAGTAPVNLALTAVAIVAPGLPLWWLAWRSAQRSCLADPGSERASVSRRIYLVSLTGVGVLVAVGSLVGTVYLLFEDLFAGAMTLGTLRSMRFVLGVLVASAGVAGAHAALFRTERALYPHVARRPRFVILVGSADQALARQVAQATAARVLSWPRTDGVEQAWSAQEVVRLVAASPGPDVVVVNGPRGLRAIPVDRTRGDVAAVTVPASPPSDHPVGA